MKDIARIVDNDSEVRVVLNGHSRDVLFGMAIIIRELCKESELDFDSCVDIIQRDFERITGE